MPPSQLVPTRRSEAGAAASSADAEPPECSSTRDARPSPPPVPFDPTTTCGAAAAPAAVSDAAGIWRRTNASGSAALDCKMPPPTAAAAWADSPSGTPTLLLLRRPSPSRPRLLPAPPSSEMDEPVAVAAAVAAEASAMRAVDIAPACGRGGGRLWNAQRCPDAQCGLYVITPLHYLSLRRPTGSLDQVAPVQARHFCDGLVQLAGVACELQKWKGARKRGQRS